MALVDYSGSESDSDNEEQATVTGLVKPRTTSNKPAFQKVVDRSNPHKIKVSLPEPTRATAEDEELDPEPPTKRAKIGSAGMGGFNSFLPAPKRTAASNGGSGVGGIRRGGIGSGVNLRTGAAPAFSREPAPSTDESSGRDGNAEGQSVPEASVPDVAPSSIDMSPEMQALDVEPAPKKKSTIFKPLSVANKKAQKKKVPSADTLRAPASTNTEVILPPKGASKISLFAAGDESNEALTTKSRSNGTYEPMVYHAEIPTATLDTNPNHEEPAIPQDYTTIESTYPQSQPTQAQAQSLDAIANDLNLSTSAKRQLLGRTNKVHSSQPSSIPNIVNFNTDEEYAANELLRQAGETLQHNPVRGIAPGKHSLKQLVNAASNQKDALEEQFASGRRNKKEAGSKYGW